MKSKIILLTASCLLVLLARQIGGSLSNGFIIAMTPKASAQSLNIQIDEINTAPDETIPTPVQLTSPPLQSKTAEEKISPGIQSFSQIGLMSFSVSSHMLDFGALSPANPVIRNIKLSIISEFTDYQILAYENHPPRTNNNIAIPDTTCDNGSCTEKDSSVWENGLTYGFGLRCEALTYLFCIEPFGKNEYRQVPNVLASELPEALIKGIKNKKPQEAQLDFKLNIGGTQQSGTYTNTVTFLAVPNY